MTYLHQDRLARFRAELQRAGLEGAVVSLAPHVFYLSGLAVGGPPRYLLVDHHRTILILQEGMRAAFAVPHWIETVTYLDYGLIQPFAPHQTASAALERVVRGGAFAGKRIGVEVDDLRATDLLTLQRGHLPVSLGPILPGLRRCKDASEIQQIRVNVAVLEAGFDAARATIRPGVTELEVWAAVHAAMMTKFGGSFAPEGNLGSGPNTHGPDPYPTHRQLARGDLVFIDLYPVLNGYVADLTRTFAVGPPTARQQTHHAVLEEALARAVAALRPGVRACEIYETVRARIAEAGLADYFPHHAGHGLGLMAPEAPFLIPADDTPLVVGDIIAVEPGLYDPNVGGMRLEGNYLITETGAESLTDYPFELIECL